MSIHMVYLGRVGDMKALRNGLRWLACTDTWCHGDGDVWAHAVGHVWVRGPTKAEVWVKIHDLCCHQWPSRHSWFGLPPMTMSMVVRPAELALLFTGHNGASCGMGAGEVALTLISHPKISGPSGVDAGELVIYLSCHPQPRSRVLSWPTPASTLLMSWCSIWSGWSCRTKALGSPWLRVIAEYQRGVLAQYCWCRKK